MAVELDYDAQILGTSDMIRMRLTFERGQVVAFTVQYEAWIDDRYWPVVRYDSQHGRPHRDILDWSGRATKDWTWPGADLSLAEAATLARHEIGVHWERERTAFFRRRPRQ